MWKNLSNMKKLFNSLINLWKESLPITKIYMLLPIWFSVLVAISFEAIEVLNDEDVLDMIVFCVPYITLFLFKIVALILQIIANKRNILDKIFIGINIIFGCFYVFMFGLIGLLD